VRGAYRLPEANTEKGILTSREMDALNVVAWINVAAKLAFELTSKTGLRLGEVRGLQIEDLEDGFLFIRHAQSDEMDLKDTKNGKPKRVPVSGELLQALRNLVTTKLSPVNLG